MKNIFKIGILALTVAVSLVSCDKEDPIGSRITVYPEMILNGDAVVVLTEGDAFTDQGAISYIGEDQVEVTTTGSVDATTPGVYDLYYSSVNEDGFSAQLRRTIIVLSAEPSAINLEGTFYRNGNPNTITKVSDRVYTSNNAGGLALSDAANLLAITFYNIDDERIYAPYTVGASTSGINVETNIGTIVNANSFNWVLYASAYYGTAVRNFTR